MLNGNTNFVLVRPKRLKTKEFLRSESVNTTKSMQKYYRILYILLFLGISIMAQDNNDAGYHVKTVVIDAGHGGKDPGALGSFSKEKDIVLSIALKAGDYIKENFPNTKVIYTRDTDRFLKIYERSDIANKNDADLFISIHANAAANKAAYGTETFVMGKKYLGKNFEYMKKENDVIFMEDNYEQNYELNPQSPQAQILLSMMQAAYLDNSIKLAAMVEDQFKNRVGRHSRGVHQSVLYVLYNTKCPSVLIETGFISNAKEEKFLNSEQGQVYLASGIYRAFRDYKLQSEGWSKSERDSLIKIQKEKGLKLPDGPKPVENIEEDKKEVSKPTRKEEKSNKKESASNADKSKNKSESPVREKPRKRELNIYFSVQITSSSDQIKLDDAKLKNASDVFEYEHGGWFKYASGKFANFEKAFKHKQDLKSKGFEGVFVIAFEKEERISIQEAKEKLK